MIGCGHILRGVDGKSNADVGQQGSVAGKPDLLPHSLVMVAEQVSEELAAGGGQDASLVAGVIDGHRVVARRKKAPRLRRHRNYAIRIPQTVPLIRQGDGPAWTDGRSEERRVGKEC